MCTEGLRASSIHVDAGDVGGDESGSLDGGVGIGGADLEDEFTALFLRMHAVYDAISDFGARRNLGTLRWLSRPIDRPSFGIVSSRGSDHGAIDGLGAYARVLTRDTGEAYGEQGGMQDAQLTPEEVGAVVKGQQTRWQLAGAHHRGEHDLATIVDTPAGNGDVL